MTTTIVLGADVQVGDDLVDWTGTPRRITSTEPYDASVLGLDDPGARLARSHNGWVMTLLSSQMVEVAR